MRKFFTFFALVALCLTANAQTETIDLDASVFFASASHEPDAAELDKLATFANQLTGYADYTLRIEAFTDEQGTDAYNEALAQRRAAAITRVLAQTNVEPTSSIVLTHGEQLARTNTSDDTERRNDRRVDLVARVTRWTDAAAAIKVVRDGQRQNFSIDVSQPQVITGREGGVFLIEPNTLVRADGKPVVGPVTVEVTEAYDFADMLLAGLTTTSAGKRLATGGMVNINAVDATGAGLELRGGTQLKASIPTDDFNERMRIFSGAGHDGEGVPQDWALTEAGVMDDLNGLFPKTTLPANELSSDEYAAIDKKVKVKMASWLSRNPKPKTPEYHRLNRYRTKEPRVLDESKIVYKPSGLGKIFMSEAKQKRKTEEKKAEVNQNYERRLARHERKLELHGKYSQENESMRVRYEAELAAWELKYAENIGTLTEEMRTKYIRKSNEAFAALRKARREAQAERIRSMEDAFRNSDDLAGKIGEVSRYFFTISGLGWTNIDIYTNDEDPIQVMASLPNSTQDATVMMIPSDRRSVIAFSPTLTGQWARGGIPRGAGYHVVAYQVLNGQMMLAHRYVDSAQDGVVTKLTYAPVAILDLKDKLDAILGS